MITRRFGARLNASDALLWTIEQDPSLRTTIVAVSVLDCSPDWDRLRLLMSHACDEAPRFRQRIVETPLRLGAPRWELDDQFDLDYHLRRVVVPERGDLRSVLDLAAPAAMGVFDMARPLWEFTLVDGLSGGRAALVEKVHHAFTDGVGGIELAGLLLDRRRDARPRRSVGGASQSQHRSPLSSAARSMTSNLYATAAASAHAARTVRGLVTRATRDPVGLASTTLRQARSIGRLLAPVTRPLSPVMTERGLSRRLDAFDVPLNALLTAGHASGCSLNDAFLASIAGGVRRYHQLHDVPADAVRVTMPISTRRPDDPLGSNRFVPARFTLPVSTLDAAERMLQLGRLAAEWRSEPALPLTDSIAVILDRLPTIATTSLFGSMLKGVDLVATNIPGLTKPGYLAGAKIVRQYAFAPPSGAAFSAALLSHLDQCCIGINADTAAVPDPEVLTECLRDGFEEVVAVGRRA